MSVQALGDFDKLLLKTVDETLSYALGETNARIIYRYLEEKSCPFLEVPLKLDIFSRELREVMGSGKRQIIGSGKILEETIVAILWGKLGLECTKKEPFDFVDAIGKLKDVYSEKKNGNVHPFILSSRAFVSQVKKTGQRDGGEKA